jgi:DDE superfamily endonuclease
MTTRLPVVPAPTPLEAYATQFDALFTNVHQRQAFRRYLEGLLLPAERNKTLTALANTEPIVGAQHPAAQALQWFLSESTWDPETVNRRRLDLLRADPLTAPSTEGVLVIDEHGDRKWGSSTAHVGRQYLANLGKIDNGVVSVTSLWADEDVYYPLHVTPYTMAHHFSNGTADPAFRTKLQLALVLVDAALAAGFCWRAVVADCFYGEDETFKQGLRTRRLGYVLALKPSHSWWHHTSEVGSLQEAAQAGGWTDAATPGQWVGILRRFRDGHIEQWWGLEVRVGPYGPGQTQRAVVVTTDPATLPDHVTWYLVTNLPAPGSKRAQDADALQAADLDEVVRLYGLRMWVEQSYKHTRGSLGWSQYQVRGDLAIRRHWQLVCCAFSFCWFHQSQTPGGGGEMDGAERAAGPLSSPPTAVLRRKKNESGIDLSAAGLLAGGAAAGAGVAGAVDHAVALLAWLVGRAPTASPPAPP